MYTGSLESTRYLLLTEFEGRTACYRTSFFRSDLWQSTKCAGAINRAEKNRLVLTVSTYVINQQNFWGICILHWKETWDGRNPYRVVNDSATYFSIFGGLGNKFTKWFFPEGLLMYQTSSGFCWCLLQRKTVCFENSDNTLTQFGRFMLLMNHQNVFKNVYFTPLNQPLLKGEIDSSRRALSV